MFVTVLSWWAWTETVLCTILGTPIVAAVWLVTRPFDPGVYAAGRTFRLVAVVATLLNPLWRFRTLGTRRLDDPRRPYVVVANHESYADVFLISCFPWEMKWLSKQTFFRIPCLGWMMQMAGDIKLVRGNRDSTMDAIASCKDRLAKRTSVMIFPEGTRSKTKELLPFKDGAFRLAIETQTPILPIAVAGTRACMAKGSFQFRPARAVAEVLSPVETHGLTLADLPALKDRVRSIIDDARHRLAREHDLVLLTT
ncbi:MAG: 1-acyl-sn-glycerol-3-phosphate acyltransferase [Gemmatimonadaceae bacterium]|jgi:1-acyl-sn-glycerol-3-phosphate acyltransferase|nr:1-acyl-sn-glycerol-3-phosphate acyltransferase [Gemmatimonadaceae bacterium]